MRVVRKPQSPSNMSVTSIWEGSPHNLNGEPIPPCASRAGLQLSSFIVQIDPHNKRQYAKNCPKLFLIILSICPNDERAIAIFAFFRLQQLYSRRFDSRFDRFDSQPAINVRKACARCPPRAFAAHTTAAILLRIPPRRAGSESSCT